MVFTAADFDNLQVDGSCNPSEYGHHHGPIHLRSEPIEVPGPTNAPQSQGAEEQKITIVETRAQSLSGLNGLVCDIAVNGNQMCGKTFRTQPDFRRHLRVSHAGYTLTRDRKPLQIEEKIAGQNALKKRVRDVQWRNARYVYEPRRAHNESLVFHYATAMERIANEDAEFARKFGTKFHRKKATSLR